jgi:DNA-binding transcriptional LysR family regulator
VEIRHLRYFLAVAEELNFSRAAEKLNIAQPPLSQQIKQLESELGVRLFDRDSRPVRLSDAGRYFSEHARTLVQRFDLLKKNTQRLGRAEEGTLSIGFVGSATCEVLPSVLRQFRTDYPGVELTLNEMSAREQKEALLERQINVGFLRPSVDDELIMIEPLLEEDVILACPVSHPIAQKTSVALSSLSNESFVSFPRNPEPSFGAYLSGLCRDAGFEPKVTQETHELNTALSLVAGGIGIAMMPASIRAIERSGVVYVPFKKPVPTTVINVAYRRDDSSPALNAFLAIMRLVLGISAPKGRKGNA